MPAANRRLSWKTSSQRRSRSNAKGNSIGASNGINNVSQYTKQLNPYKSLSTSLRGSHGSNNTPPTRGVDDDDINLIKKKEDGIDNDLDLGDSSDDELGLDNILSSIENDDSKVGTPTKKNVNGSAPKADIESSSIPSNLNTKAAAPQSVDVIDELAANIDAAIASKNKSDTTKNNGSNPDISKQMKKLLISPVDFEKTDIPHRKETSSPFTQYINEADNISPVSEEDNDTLWTDGTDGDATRQHRLLVQAGNGPAFAGFSADVETRIDPVTGAPTFQATSAGVKRNSASDSLLSSLNVDSIMDDIVELSGEFNDKDRNQIASDRNESGALTPQRGGRYSYNKTNPTQSSIPELTTASNNNTASTSVESPPSVPAPKKYTDRNKRWMGSKRTMTSGNVIQTTNPTEDETLSTVTDPTESPFIYTYKKPSADDDSVSQITSSLAGNSYGSSQLQNVPTNFGSGRASGRTARTGLSWMNTNGPGLGGGGVGSGSSRMIQRKGAISGPYGRDRHRKLSGNGRTSRGSSNSGSGSGSVSYDDGKNNLDEIAYALNSDCAPTTTTTAGRKKGAPVRRYSHDLSTVESSRDCDGQSTYDYIDANTHLNSNVSRLGMGGVSCGAQSVHSETNSIGDSTVSSMGFIQHLALLAWKAQHHAGRFFFPTSPEVKQRKKFDRSDSFDELADILLEEGTNTLSHRRQQKNGSGKRGSYEEEYEDDDEEIDYFGRATGHKPKKKKKKRSGTARLGTLFFAMTIGFIVYRMPERRRNRRGIVRMESPDEFRSRNDRIYDSDQGELEYEMNNPMVGNRERNNNIRFGKKRIEPDMELADTPVLEEPHFLVGDVQLPEKFEVLANVDELFQRGIDVPFYWHVPRSGGGTMNDVLGSCLHLTLAADAGGSDGQDEVLKVLHFSHQVSYVNVDTSTFEGIERAKNLNLISSGLADVVISPLLHEASSLFTPTRRGRMFTVFRHPVERAASLFYFIQDTQWRQPETRNDQFADITIETFYKNGFAETNWMTRFLTNELTKGELTEKDLDVAKEVLRQKCLIGLLEEKGETFERMQKYFGWRPKNEEEQDCLERKLGIAWPMQHRHPAVEEDSRAWKLICSANKFDMRLYEYAEELFSMQEQQLFSKYLV